MSKIINTRRPIEMTARVSCFMEMTRTHRCVNRLRGGGGSRKEKRVGGRGLQECPLLFLGDKKNDYKQLSGWIATLIVL